jgi:hypothetical protein
MSEPSRPDTESTEPVEQADPPVETEPATEAIAVEEPESTRDDENGAEPTEVLPTPQQTSQEDAPETPKERRFTAPSGFDAGSTEKIDTPPEPETEVLSVPGSPSAPTEMMQVREPAVRTKTATPQAIPPRGDVPRLRAYRSWGWVVALILVIAALAAVAIIGTIWLTRNSAPKISQEDLVRQTIQNFDIAVQKGDLATLRGITCGSTRDSYVNYNERAWADTHARVAAAKQYPVVASIDQVVVNGEHAEANVTTFMAYDPATRSTRSFDLQYRDDQWKICQAPSPR